jgi:hypothetical protein
VFSSKVNYLLAAPVGIGVLSFVLGVIAMAKLSGDPAAAGAGQPSQPAKDDGLRNGVVVVRVPEKGIQPQVAVDGKGIVHLLYYKGDAGAGDIFYARSDDGAHFKHPLWVNSQSGSAIAIGNIRGAHLALGKNGRPHVAWNGSQKAAPKAPGDAHPMLYTRLDDEGKGFEPQRNLIQATGAVLDGGGSVAADGAGNVYVFWHSPGSGKKGEVNRRVWVAVSTDDGKTFAAEKAATDEPTGACGCCGLRAFADKKGTVYTLYRGAKTVDQRDMYLLSSVAGGKEFKAENVDPWAINMCPMSSEAFAEGPGFVAAAWDTKGQVYFARIDAATGKRSPPIAAPGTGHGRKHPALAVNAKGETLLAWTEGMGWERGGSVAWQVYDKNGNPTHERGRADGVPVWSLVAAYVQPDGRFAVMY